MKLRLLTTLVFTGILAVNTIVKAQAEPFRVVGYFVNWYDTKAYARTFDYSQVTHLNYAFVNVASATGDLDQPGSDLDTLVGRAHAKNVKVMASLGGGAQTTNTRTWYNDLLLTQESRSMLAHNFVLFLDKYKLDGWDIDLEGDLIKKGYYDAFIKTLSDSLKPKGKLLTAALGGGGWDNFEDATLAYFDFINIMSYDFTGAWTPNDPGQHSSYEHAVQGVTSWSARGAKKEQLCVGLPFYCHAFLTDIASDYINYSDILQKYPYAYNQDTVGNILFYNGIPTIKRKTYMALEKASGVMIWALQYDVTGEKSLLKAINDAIKSYSKDDVAPVIKIKKPTADTTITSSTINLNIESTDADGVFMKNNCYLNGIKALESTNSTDVLNLKNLSAGKYTVVVEAQDHQYKSGYDTINVTVGNDIARSPFNGVAVTIPGKIEAENYDVGGAGVTFNDNSTGNNGNIYRADAVDIQDCLDKGTGYSVGWTTTGEWLEYTINVADTGHYDMEFRVATTYSGKTVAATVDGVDVTGSVKMTSTGSWQNWKSVMARNFYLKKGQQVLRLKFTSADFNINYIKISVAKPSSIYELQNAEISLYPVPAQNTIQVQLGNVADFKGKFEIIDMNGRVVLSKTSQLNTDNIDISNLSKGVYLFRVVSNQSSLVQRFVKE